MVTPSVVTHGSLTVRINEDKQVTQTNNIIRTNGALLFLAGAVEDDTEIITELARASSLIQALSCQVVDAVNGVCITIDLVKILVHCANWLTSSRNR